MSLSLTGGGAERWAANTISYLNENSDFRISLALFRDEKTYPIPEAVQVHRVDHRHVGQSIRTVRRMQQLLLNQNVDVVISAGTYTGQFVGEAVRRTGTPWIARISGNIQYGNRSLLQRLGWRVLDRNIDTAWAIVGNSESMAGEVQSRWPHLS
ncbi:MAG: glycosyltransferase, partial [Planctomycetota bacterium]